METKIREVKETHDFKSTGTFTAYHDAEQWCKDNGYSIGSMCSPAPTAIMKGDWNVAKWKNLSRKDIETVDGIITGHDYREGDVKVLIYK